MRDDDYHDDYNYDDEYEDHDVVDGDEYAEDDFDYENFVAENFSDSSTNTQASPMWRFVAIVLLLAFVVPVLLSLLRAFSP